MTRICRVTVALLAVAAAFVLSPPQIGHAAKWDPVDPKELALAAPLVEKDADAEVLLWDVRVADQFVGNEAQTVYQHYMRVKIFTDRGRDAQSRVDIPMFGSVRVRDVEGRSIKRDGTFVELKKSDVFDRDLVKLGGLKVRATSFVLPSAETGGILEYRWREIRDENLSNNLRLPFSSDIPVQLVKYHISPLGLAGLGYVMKGRPFHATPTPLTSEGRFYSTSMSNVPAYREEPHAPSGWELRPWLLIYYAVRADPPAPAEFWLKFSRERASEYRKATEPTAEIEQAAANLGVGSGTLDEKIHAIVAFCRAKIVRLDVDTVSDAERKGFKWNESPTAALAKGRGTASDVAMLFVAMARALGLDARIALLPSRNDVTFNPAWMLPQLFTGRIVAIRDKEAWRMLDPTHPYAPDGHLAWTQESQEALIPDERAVVSVSTPASPPEWTTRTRTGTFRLSEDGTLEGDVTTEFTGHLDLGFKVQEDHRAPAERIKSLKEELSGRMASAELSDVSIDNVTDVGKPYSNRYHLKVPGYAQRTGSRLFFQPAVLQKGVAPTFQAATRRDPIFFDFAWKEVDRISIVLPAGYELESPDAPREVPLGRLGGYSMKLAKRPDGTRVEMTRELTFGGDGRLQFPAASYNALKMFFDQVHKNDGHTLSLRRAAAGGRP